MNRRSIFLALSLVSLLGASACSRRGSCGDADLFGGPGSDSAPPKAAASSSGGAPGAANASPSSAAAARAIAEADIVQLDDVQDRIYAMSKTGGLAIVDASVPARLSLMGKTSLPGQPFEMYRRGDVLLTMSNAATGGDGNLHVTLSEDAAPREPIDSDGAALLAIDVKSPGAMKTLASFKVPGEIADSRIVGNILYLATYETSACWSCGASPRTLVTSFDVSDPTAPKKIDQVSYDTSAQAGGFNAAWSTPWKRSITATTSRIYVGGLASDATTTTDEGVIEVLDISDPAGHLRRGAKVTMAGPVMSRWQMDESGGVLRVISQRGAGRTQNGERYPDIDTFRIDSSDSLVRVGHTTMTLPKQEGLKTVRFDGTRAYAITFNQTDPLFTIDLTDPAKPTQRGQLALPGWVFHLEPRGDRLLGLGLDRNDAAGNLNVSLFDVSNLDHPSLVQRVSFGPTHMYEDYMITSGVLAEDQDRIQKAFRIFSDGIIAIPFSSGTGACEGGGGGGAGVELLDWTPSSLRVRGLLPVSGNPRRAVRRDSDVMREVIAISDSNVRSFQIDRPDATQTADVVIGTCRGRTTPTSQPIPMPKPMGDGVIYGTGGPGSGDMPRGYGDDTPHGTGYGYAHGTSVATCE